MNTYAVLANGAVRGHYCGGSKSLAIILHIEDMTIGDLIDDALAGNEANAELVKIADSMPDNVWNQSCGKISEIPGFSLKFHENSFVLLYQDKVICTWEAEEEFDAEWDEDEDEVYSSFDSDDPYYNWVIAANDG